MSSILLGRQAIMDVHQNVVAYELLFRSSNNHPINCDLEASANVITNTLSNMSIDNVLGTKRGFINIGIEILRKGFLNIIPPNRFIIEILETQKPSDELVSLIQKFKRRGYIFALDDFIINDEQFTYWENVLKEVHIVKVDVLDTPIENIINHSTRLKEEFNVALLAEKVEDIDTFNICLENGYQYFQGYFFTKPVILKSANTSPSMQGIMSVISHLQKDADISDIENTLKGSPELVISLLKIVNSSSVAPVQEITSIRQGIALLGKKALTQWLMLLLYSAKATTGTSPEKRQKDDPLFLTATQRGKMMELLLIESNPKAPKSLKDEAFLAGLLSFADTLLHRPIEEILKELHVSNNISQAILSNEGTLGNLLILTKAFEVVDFDIINQISQELNINADTINKASHLSLKFSKELASLF